MDAFLEVAAVARRFGGINAVDDVSFAVRKGETYGIIGPNGAGKTVLLNTISGVYQSDSGEIRIGGIRTDRLRPHEIARRGVARTFQSMEQFREFRVADYVMLGRIGHQRSSVVKCALNLPGIRRSERDERERAMATLERFDLRRFAARRMSELPYGVQKQIDIARVVAAEPQLMLLDEPTSGTTSTDRNAISEILETVSATSATLVIVDHDVNFMSTRCERLLVMNYGKVIAEGAPEGVLQKDEVIAVYLGT